VDRSASSSTTAATTPSTDGGRSWVNERVTSESFDVPPLNPNFDPLVKSCYMGDYNDGTADADGFYLTWGDNRRILKAPRFSRGRPDPDVRFRAVEHTYSRYIGLIFCEVRG
jgi:hypothetical protein